MDDRKNFRWRLANLAGNPAFYTVGIRLTRCGIISPCCLQTLLLWANVEYGLFICEKHVRKWPGAVAGLSEVLAARIVDIFAECRRKTGISTPCGEIFHTPERYARAGKKRQLRRLFNKVNNILWKRCGFYEDNPLNRWITP